jgi:centromere protein C
VQTRSGRHSYKPLEFWKGEHVTYDNEEVQDDTYRNRRMVLPSVKEVIRVEDDEEDTRRARKKHTRGRKPTGKRRAAAQEEQEEEEQEEPEEWERDPGVISGDVVLWEPQHELYPPGNDAHVEVVEDQLAVSSDAILTRDIHDASFRFAKTLNMSFMGSGIVDLPPGAEKKPKNSRKMQMVFFVFYGKVLVTVNETEFRISAGGQWFVPRGMFPMARHSKIFGWYLKLTLFLQETTTVSRMTMIGRRGYSSPKPARSLLPRRRRSSKELLFLLTP